MIVEYYCWKKYRIEGMEKTNWAIYIMYRAELTKVQVVQGSEIIQKHGAIGVSVIFQSNSEKNRYIKSEKDLYSNNKGNNKELQVNEKPN